MLSNIVTVIVVFMVGFSLQTAAASILQKDEMLEVGALTEKEFFQHSTQTDGVFNNESNPSSIRNKRTIAKGTIGNTFFQLCLKAIDKYNRENGVTTTYVDKFKRFVFMAEEGADYARRGRYQWDGIVENWERAGEWAETTYSKTVKKLTGLTENVYKNSKLSAKTMAATAMKRVQEVVDGRVYGRWNHRLEDRDAGHESTLKMWTEIYHRGNKTYPAIFGFASESVMLPSNVANEKNKDQQNEPKAPNSPGEKSSQSGVFRGYASLLQTQQKITPTPPIATVTDRVSTQTGSRSIRRNSIKDGQAISSNGNPVNTRIASESEDFPSLDSLRITEPSFTESSVSSKTRRRNQVEGTTGSVKTGQPLTTNKDEESTRPFEEKYPTLGSLRVTEQTNTRGKYSGSGSRIGPSSSSTAKPLKTSESKFRGQRVSSETSRRNPVEGTTGSVKTAQPLTTSRRNLVEGTTGSVKTRQPLTTNKAEVSTEPSEEEFPTLGSLRITEQTNTKTKNSGSRIRSTSSTTTTKPPDTLGSKFRGQRHRGPA